MILKVDGVEARAVYSVNSSGGALGWWNYKRYVIPVGTHTVRWEIGGIAPVNARLDEVSFSATEAELYVGDVAISNGDTTVSTGDGTDFGSVQLGRSVSHFFRLGNHGTRELTVQSVQVSGVSADEFTLRTNSFVLTPGASDLYGVTFSPIRLFL